MKNIEDINNFFTYLEKEEKNKIDYLDKLKIILIIFIPFRYRIRKLR